MNRTDLMKSFGMPNSNIKLTELMTFTQNLLETLHSYDVMEASHRATVMSVPATASQPIHQPQPPRPPASVHMEVPETPDTNLVTSHFLHPIDEEEVENHQRTESASSASLLDDLMATNAIAIHKESRRPNQENAKESAPMSKMPSYYPDMDVLVAPDVEPIYRNTLPVAPTVTKASDTVKNRPSEENSPAAPNRKSRLQGQKPSPPAKSDNVLHDRLLRAQQAFASLREPPSSSTTTNTTASSNNSNSSHAGNANSSNRPTNTRR